MIQFIKIFIDALRFSFSFYGLRHKQKIENLEKIYECLKIQDNKPNLIIGELFYETTKLRLSITDIQCLLFQDNVMKILYYLKKYPRIYQFKDGIFQLADNYEQEKSVWIDAIFKWLFLFLAGLSFIAYILSDDGYHKFINGLGTIIMLIMWVSFLQLEDERNDANKLFPSNHD